MAYLELCREKQIDVILDPAAASGIRKIWNKVEKDLAQTTGAVCRQQEMGAWSGDPDKALSQAILIATAGDALAVQLERKLPGVQALAGTWERYGFWLVEQPLPGVEQGLVIVGSDRLGTIYGMFRLSELLGVTAWGFWGDVTPPEFGRALLCADAEEAVSSCEGRDAGLNGRFTASECCNAEAVSSCEGTDADLCGRFAAAVWDSGEDGFRTRKICIRGGLSKEPSVRYRGFFINDEWPCFGNWTFSHYGGFTAEMYDHVFEYLLRMKGNYLWPAMWTSSFLLDGPDLASMELATEYGIYIGMSHHEPCMRSGEEFSIFKGEDSPYGMEWSYAENQEGLLRFWEDGLKRVKGQQIFPTIGMRGERDSKMLGEDATIDDNVRQLKEIIKNQRRLIAEQINPDLSQVPQLFAVYKEVEDYYFGDGRSEGIRGYEELEDVTLLFCEDNFGNMRALPQGEERLHPGGFGMYYHLDYHGAPISYEWVTSTPLTKIWEQMTQAYEYGVQKLWIVNVGDVKFQEYPLGFFMELAYDFDAWGTGAYDRIPEYTKQWVRNQFGGWATEKQLEEIRWVLEEYIRLNALRRPEALNDRIYHPAHHQEGIRMLERCRTLEQRNERLMKELAGSPCADGYFSMIYYPAAGSANLLAMHLTAGLNHLYSAQGKAAANLFGEQTEACIRRDAGLNAQMASFRNGKWSGMEQEQHIGFVNWNDEDWRYPVRHVVTLAERPRLVVSRTDEMRTYTNQYFPVPLEINDFLYLGTDTVTIQVANGGQGCVEWKLADQCEFLEFSSREGCTAHTDEIVIRVLRDQLPEQGIAEFDCRICTGHETVPLLIRARRWNTEEIPSGAFLIEDGVCVMNAEDFLRSASAVPAADGEQDAQAGAAERHQSPDQDAAEGNAETNQDPKTGAEAKFERLGDYGKYGSGMKVFPTTESFAPGCTGAPSLTYGVWAEEGGSYTLQLHISPANPLNYGGPLRMGVSVNGEAAQTVSFVGEDYRGGDHTCEEWCRAVLDQEHAAEISVTLHAGYNEITVHAGDAGIVLERLVLYAAGHEPKQSYLGAAESWHKG